MDRSSCKRNDNDFNNDDDCNQPEKGALYMLNKKFGIPFVCLMSAALLSACSNDGEKKSAENTQLSASVIDYTKEPFELVMQDLAGGAEAAFNSSYGQYIKKKFPNLTIKFIQSKAGSTLQDLTVSGQYVDIVSATIDNMPGPLIATGQQFDMTDLIKKHGVDLSRFEQTTIEGVKAMGEGKIFYLPVTNIVQVLFYNKSIFDKLGVSYPKDGMTWDDLNELSKKLTRSDGGVNYMGYSASPNHILRMNQLSLPVFDPKTQKPTFTDEKWKTLIQTYFLNNNTQTYKAYSVANKKLPYYTEMTATQQLAMMVFNSAWPFDGPQYVKDIDWDLVSLPTFKENPKVGSQVSPRMFAITKTAKDKDGAMAVIKYLTSVEMQTEFSKLGSMTVLNDDNVKKVIGTESIHKGKNWKAVYYNSIAPLSSKSIYDAGILYAITPNVLKAVTGEMDINTALRDAQEVAEKFVETEKKK